MSGIETIKINEIEYIRKDSILAQATKSADSIIRTFSAGVHVGEVVSVENQKITLKNARRIWKWAGAFTLNAVATSGVTRKESRISVPVPEICLLDCVEIIPVLDGVDLSTTEK